jgi:hypothetical protein
MTFSSILPTYNSVSDSSPTSEAPDTPQDSVIKFAFDVMDPNFINTIKT